jgi:hypothetical protein
MLSDLLLALCSAFVCTIHYLGVISFVLVTGAELACRRALGLPVARGLAAAAVGPLCFLACLPLLWSQRAAFSIATWVPSATLGRSYDFLATLLLPAAFAVLPIAACLARTARSADKAIQEDGWLPKGEPSGQAALLGLLLFPVVLILFSFLVQPAEILRYGLPAIAGLAPVAAFALARMPRGLIVACAVFFLVASARELRTLRSHYQTLDEKKRQLIAEIRRLPAESVVVFGLPLDLLLIGRYAPDQAHRCFLLEYREDQFPDASAYHLFCRDLARNYQKYYGGPASLPWDALQVLPSFFADADVAPWADSHQRTEPLPEPRQDARLLPGYTGRSRPGAQLIELTNAPQ